MTDTVKSAAALISDLSDGAPAHSTTRQVLRNLLVSVPSMTGVINVREPRFGAVGDGVADDYAAIVAADTAAGVEGKDLSFPPGTYKTSGNLICARRWKGVPGATVIQPTAAVTKCIDLRTGGWGDGIDLDGVNTSGKTGLDVGSALLVNILGWSHSRIHNFLGVGGRGIKIAQLVTGFFENLYIDSNYINLHTNGGNTPTDTEWNSCQFRQATTKGVWIETGFGLRFIKPLFEANGEEGLYFQNVGGTAVEIEIDGGWSEDNWHSLVGDPSTRATKFAAFVDGANGPSGTIRAKFRNHKYDGETAQAIHLTNAIAFLVDAVHVVPTGGQKILVDGTSYGQFSNWPEQNGAFNTKVTMPAITVPGTAPVGFNARQRIEDAEGPWTDWVPVVTGSGAMTITGLTIFKARYKITGKTITVSLTISFTTATATGNVVLITLPPNVRSFDALGYEGVWIDDGAYKDGYMQPDGASPTSSIQVGRKDIANWTLGTNRAVKFVRTFELF